MSELFQAEILRRLAELEHRIDQLAQVLSSLLQQRPTADPAPTPPWRVTSSGGAL